MWRKLSDDFQTSEYKQEYLQCLKEAAQYEQLTDVVVGQVADAKEYE